MHEPVRNLLNPDEQKGNVCHRHISEGEAYQMGTIVTRKRKGGAVGHKAQIILRKDGKVIHQEAKTFDRRPAAVLWLERREAELSRPGALDRRGDPILAAVIDRYIDESNKAIGRTKEQVLRSIKAYPLAAMRCSKIESHHIVTFAKSLDVQPQTVSNYLSHLAAIFKLARPAWGYALDRQAIKDAFVVCKDLGTTSKSRKRDRRPTLDELDRLMVHFGAVQDANPKAMPMRRLIVFALFSTRRQEEITRILWSDYEPAHNGDLARVLVRDMKNPGGKVGNNVWVDLPPEAAAVIENMPKIAKEIFPFKATTISANFTRACALLAIDDLHFHDLRHEGISRLFEMDTPIPRVTKVSGHRDWKSVQRYEHLRQTGDKYANWKWKTP
jgi:integrase